MINVMITDCGKDTADIAAVIAQALSKAGFKNIASNFKTDVVFPPNKQFPALETERVSIASYSSGL